jgi:hypothetical protein
VTATGDKTVVHLEQRQCQCRLCVQSRAYGKTSGGNGYVTVPADHVRWHIRMLLESGHTTGSIAACASVRHDTVNNIIAGRVRMTRRETADAVLGVAAGDPPTGAGNHDVSVLLVKPLVEEMRRVGWTYRRINADAGISNSWKSTNLGSTVRWETWRRVTTLYEILARRGLVDASLLAGVQR